MKNKTLEMNKSAFELTQKHRFADAAAIIFDLLKTHTIYELNTEENVDLWWIFCEKLADKMGVDDPSSLLPLYGLARESYAKEGSMATGSGEGISARRNIQRVTAKIKAIRDFG